MSALTIAVIWLLAGCAKPKGVMFEPVVPPIFWPQPPDAPRIRYVGEIKTDADLKPARSFGKALGESLFGKQAARSMLSPYALCTDDRDRLFVCDSNAQLVHVFDLETREYQQWKPAGSVNEVSAFAQPVGIAFAHTMDGGRLFVTDSVAARLFVLDATGRFVRSVSHESFSRPCGIAIDETRDRIFVADSGNHHVVVLNLQGDLIAVIGERGSGIGQFNFPTNVAVSNAGHLIVSDTLNFRVQIFDSDLKPIRHIGRQGDMPGYFSNPKGVAVDTESHLYVIDAHFEAVQIFDLDGNLLLTFGEEGQAPGQFWLPSGIHIDKSDRIWIADPYNRRVQVFDYQPEVLP